MSEELIQFDPVKHRQDWMRKLANEYIKLESSMPVENFLPDDGTPKWVEFLEREVGASMFPVAKLKEELKLTPKRLGAIIGHQCAVGVWLMEWFASQEEIDISNLTSEQVEKSVSFYDKFTIEWYGSLRRLAKRALASCVDQRYDDMKDFLLTFATAFAKKPSGSGVGGMGNPALPIYNFMLFNWRLIEKLNSVHHLHEVLVEVFGPYRVGDLKRTEKICQRIGLHYRKPGRPKKTDNSDS